MARARGDSWSLGEFHPVLTVRLHPCPAALALFCGQVFGSADKMRIWPKFVSVLTYRAGPWRAGVVWKTDCDSVIKNCIGICMHKKVSINWYRMPHFGHF